MKDARGFVSVNPAVVQVVAGENEGTHGKLPATGPGDGPASAGRGIGLLLVASSLVAGLGGLAVTRRSRRSRRTHFAR